MIEDALDLPKDLKNTELFIEIGSLNEFNFIIEQFPKFVKECNRKIGEFKNLSTGHLITLGYYDKHPVCVRFHYVVVNGHMISFYYPTSQLVYHPIITDFFRKKFPDVEKTDQYHQMAKFCEK